MSRRWQIGVAALLAAGVVAVVVSALTSPDSSPSPGQDDSALDVAFEYFDGGEGNLADFAGTPLVLNFWASWCPPCAAEMPEFQTVHTRLGDEVAFLGLAMQETDEDAALALIEETGVTYPLGKDPDGAIFASFGGVAMPTTVFIDGDGRVVNTHAGVLFAEDLESIVRSDLLAPSRAGE